MYKVMAVFVAGFLWLSPIAMGASPAGEQSSAQGQILNKDQVRMIQQRLKAEGVDPGPLDGVMDAQTVAALRQYQAKQGLPVSGVADEATLKQLQIQMTPSGGGAR